MQVGTGKSQMESHKLLSFYELRTNICTGPRRGIYLSELCLQKKDKKTSNIQIPLGGIMDDILGDKQIE